MMKKPFFLILISFFISAEDFKSWKAEFTFSHHEFGNFNMERDFIMSQKIISPQVLFLGL